MNGVDPTAKIHPTAIVESGASIGARTAIWDNVHVRSGAIIGCDCSIDGKSLIDYEVEIGDLTKVSAGVFIPHGVTIRRGVLIGAGTVFTNERFPRAATPDLTRIRVPDPDHSIERTLVLDGASIGAGSVIGTNLSIGRFAMVGIGSIVTKSIPDFHLAIGSPARSVGAVCRCGHLIWNFDRLPSIGDLPLTSVCEHCQRTYELDADCVVVECIPAQWLS